METALFEHIAQRLRPGLMHKARSMLGTAFPADRGELEAAADDATQDTLLRLWEVRHKVTEASELERLAWTILKNRCLDMLRTHHQAYTIDSKAVITMQASSTADTPIEENDNKAWLEQRISQLPEAIRRMWKMKQQDGLTVGQIARMLGVKESTVNNAISKARQQLVKELIKRNRQ